MDCGMSYLSVRTGCSPKSFVINILSAAFIVISVTFFLSSDSSHGRHSRLSSRSPRVWPKLEVNWRSLLATIIGFLGSAFGTVGGVGGGGIFVPMLNLIVGFDTKSAAALSKCMIMGASASSVWYNLRVSHPSKEVPIIDYDLALLFQPMLMLGITIGVALSVVFPYWLISVLIIILFLGTSSRSFFKGIQMWKEETIFKMETAEREKEAKARSEDIDVTLDSVYEPLLSPPQEKSGFEILLLNLRWRGILVLMLVWFFFLLLQILKNGTEVCSTFFWLFNILQIPVAFSVFGWEAVRLWRESRARRQRGEWECVCEASIEWSALQLFLCALCGLVGGTVGGLLGSGGGFVLGPLLLEIGVVPQVNAVNDPYLEKLLGTTVQNETEAYALYCDYAHQIGFSVRKDHTSYWPNSKKLKSKDFLCTKAGRKKSASLNSLTKFQKVDTRTGCPAMIRFSVDLEGNWTIKKYTESHNHSLAEPADLHLLRSHRCISDEKASVLKTMTEAGIRATDAFSYLTKEVGGVENIGFTKRDAFNFMPTPYDYV